MPLIEEVARALGDAGVDLGGLGLAWAKAMPTVALVPAFGLRALPVPARAVLALGLAGTVFPALVPAARPDMPWALAAVEQGLAGLPIAVAAAVPIWAATMAGGLVDNLRGAQEAGAVAVVEGKATPMGVPLSLLASAIFLSTGGPAHIASELARPMAAHFLERVAADLAGGIALAIAIGGPLLAASIVLEVAAVLVARAASPAQIHVLLAPLRAIGVLAVMAIVLDRMAAVIALAVRS